MKYYSYENFKKDTNSLIKEVQDFSPHAIVTIARGGLTLTHAVAEGLKIRNVQTLRTQLYDETKKRDYITIEGSCDFKDIERVLVLDDISDSGETLQVVMQNLACANEDIEFKSATLFYKKTSCFEPDFWINEADDWIDFFWERDFKN